MTDTIQQPNLLSDRRYGRELLRPWKLITFGAGMLWCYPESLRKLTADIRGALTISKGL